MIEITLDSAIGPFVEFGQHDDEESIERDLPEGYAADYSNSIRVATFPELRYRAPLVLTQAVADEIAQALERSESHDEIVTLDWTDARERELLDQDYSDYSDAHGTFEAWANDDDDGNGMKWRVHLKRAST